MIWLLIYLLVVSLHDNRTRRIPNWCTLPLIVSGVIAHFPGHMDLWLTCFLLISAWASGWMGAGDVKLWMAVLWALPDTTIPSLILLVFASFFLTGIAQILWRIARGQKLTNSLTPGAWRAIPFILSNLIIHRIVKY